MKKSFVVAVVALAALGGSGSAQTASSMSCVGFVTGGTYNNVMVPAGQRCVLDAVRILGGVTVKDSASLELNASTGNSSVAGGVTGNHCNYMQIVGITPYRVAVGGDFSAMDCIGVNFSGAIGGSNDERYPLLVLIGGNVKCGADDAGGCAFNRTSLGKNLECSGNVACSLDSNLIGGDVTLKNNSNYGISVIDNTIGGTLNCSGNFDLVRLRGNLVAGARTGQCSTDNTN